eukprot:5895663-Prymnesium_polylepis.1
MCSSAEAAAPMARTLATGRRRWTLPRDCRRIPLLAPGTTKRRSWPRAALAFCEERQWVITRPGSCGHGSRGAFL